MVKVGAFTVQLVAADTKTAFKEHTASDGQVFAEVEPDMDYFISLRCDEHNGGVAFIAVDGVRMGYRLNFDTPSKACYGRYERKNGESTMTALRFNSARQNKVVATPNMITGKAGKVEVSIYKMGNMFVEEAKDFASASLTADSWGGKKCIKSTNGSHSFSFKPNNRTGDNKVVNYKIGDRLRTITLNYCSAFGLVYHKILPPPPDSDTDDEIVPGVKKEKPDGAKKEKATKKGKRSTAALLELDDNVEVKSEVHIVTIQKKSALIDLTESDGED